MNSEQRIALYFFLKVMLSIAALMLGVGAILDGDTRDGLIVLGIAAFMLCFSLSD